MPVNTALIFDAVGETITSVVVDAVQVWNGVSALAGWMALSIPVTGGLRLVLDQPSTMISGSVVNVSVTGSLSPVFSYLFQAGLRQITFTDDASVPRVVETSTAPWVAYSRVPGNVYARRDDPLTDEVLVVPGDKVDVGYNEVSDEIEIVYIQNGKVFLVVGDVDDVPSTLLQPSILKSDMKTGVTGDGDRNVFTRSDFTPLKFAAPPETVSTGDTGFSTTQSFQSPPTSPDALPLVSDVVAVVVTPAQSTLITEVRLFKLRGGASVQLAAFPYSLELQIFYDGAYVPGDGYFTQAVYGDPGAPDMKRLARRGAAALGTPGDIFVTGATGSGDRQIFSKTDFAPLKSAVPAETVTSGDVGHAGDQALYRRWFPPSELAAVMSAPTSGFIVISGLSFMSQQHLGLSLLISGAASSANNGGWVIVEIISPSSVRVRAPTAPGGESGLTWTVTGPGAVAPASFTSQNTINIGVGS